MSEAPALPPLPPELVGIIRTVVALGAASRRSQFEELPPASGSVVMLGDSITEGGLWHEWFPRMPIVNRGIGGDTIEGVSARLGSAIVDPRVVSVLIGTNDIAPPGSSGDLEVVAASFDALLGQIVALAPRAAVIVNSVLPRTAELAPTLEALNAHYRTSAERHGARYLDVWPALAGNHGELRPEFTNDALHLTGLGYRAWVDILRPELEV